MILAALSTVVPYSGVLLFLSYCVHVSRGSLNDRQTSAGRVCGRSYEIRREECVAWQGCIH